MKKFDFKEFFLAKGEKVGLGICAVLGALFLVSGVMSVMGSSSTKENAKDLRQYTKTIQQKRMAARPTSQDLPQGKVEDMSEDFRLSWVFADSFRFPELFHVQGGSENKRMQPNIFVPLEFQTAVALVPLEFLDITKKDGKIDRVSIIKKGQGGIPAGGSGGGYFSQAGAAGYGFGNSSPPGAGGMMPPGIQGGFDSGMDSPPGSYPGGLGQPAASKEDNKLELEQVVVNKIGSGDRLATKAEPRRMAIVTAAFPYRAQVEEFQSKLKLSSPQAVFNETVIDKSKPEGKQRWPSFKFAGIEVQRLVFGQDGRPKVGLNGRPLGWVDLNIEDPYKAVLLENYRRFADESEDVEKYLLSVSRGLMMRLPAALDADKHYPELVSKLEKVQNAITKLKEKNVEKPAAPDPRFDSEFDAFNPNSGTPTRTGAAPSVSGGEYKPFYSEQQKVKSDELIEYSLLRFIDFNVVPGESYRYRVRVKMANPNYKKKDTYPHFAVDEFLYSEWVEVPQTVTMPIERHTYLVDEKELSETNRKKYEGQNPRESIPFTQQDSKVIMQIHQWVDYYRHNDAKLPVGQWLIGERLPFYLGEYVAKGQYAPVPVNGPYESGYVLATMKLSKKKEPAKEIPMLFGDKSVLVDIQGGRKDLRWTPPGERELILKEEVYPEVAIVRPDGSLVVHNRKDDNEDTQRRERVDAWRSMVEELKKDKKKSNTPGGSIFGN